MDLGAVYKVGCVCLLMWCVLEEQRQTQPRDRQLRREGGDCVEIEMTARGAVSMIQMNMSDTLAAVQSACVQHNCNWGRHVPRTPRAARDVPR